MPADKKNISITLLLKLGIIGAAGLLIWTVTGPMKERELKKNYLHLARVKMKTLADLQNRYFFQQATYAGDFNELKKLTPSTADSVFRPMWAAYQRISRSVFQKMSFDEFKRTYIDSLNFNPMTGEKFVMEIATRDGRPTFTIKPSALNDDLRTMGGVLDGEITWDDKAESAF
jgi:hypothetical protein